MVVGEKISIKDKHSWVAGDGKEDKGTRDISSSLASMKHIELFIQIIVNRDLRFQAQWGDPSMSDRYDCLDIEAIYAPPTLLT